MLKLFLFDLDGTLVSTGGAGLRALNRAFKDLYGVDKAMAGINPSGKTDPAIFREMIQTHLKRAPENGEINKLGDAYLSYLKSEIHVPGGKGTLNGVQSFLDHLTTRRDIQMALGTGNLEKGARIKLEPYGLNKYFSFGGFGSDAEDRAEVLKFGYQRAQVAQESDISPNDVYVIGDTPLDVMAARKAGFQSVAVASGGSNLETLKSSSPDFVWPDMTHAFAWLNTLKASE